MRIAVLSDVHGNLPALDAVAADLATQGVDVTVDLHDRVNHVTLIGAMARPLRFLAPVAREFTDFVLTH